LLIMQLVSQFGKQWRKIAERLPSRSADSVRNRYNRMQKGQEARRDLGNEHGYRCKLCNQPKRGHVCPARTTAAQPAEALGTILGTPLTGTPSGGAPLARQAGAVHEVGAGAAESLALHGLVEAIGIDLCSEAEAEVEAPTTEVAAVDTDAYAVDADAQGPPEPKVARDHSDESETPNAFTRLSSCAPNALLQELQLELAISDLEEHLSRRLSISGLMHSRRTSALSTDSQAPPLLPSDSLLAAAMSCIQEASDSATHLGRSCLNEL